VLLATTNKDFRVKHGLVVAGDGFFNGPVTVGDPVDVIHTATKGYVDEQISKNPFYEKVEAATISNINISTDTLASLEIDGSTITAGNRILIKNQTNQSQNGIYTVNESGPATRSLDFNDFSEIRVGSLIYVVSGATNEKSLWSVSSAVSEIGVDPITFEEVEFASPAPTISINPGSGIEVSESENAYTVSIDSSSVAQISTVEGGIALDPVITVSSLEQVGALNSLEVSGSATFNGATDFTESAEFSGSTIFSGATDFTNSVEFSADVAVPEPTEPAHAVNKDYVDNLLNQASVEITTIDDLSNYFNGYNSRFLPTYQGFPVTLQNEFNLLLTIDGIIQSVGSPDYVWQSVMPRVGFRIDNDGYIAFPEAIPVGSSFDARVLVGSATTTQTKVYPFKAMDIVLGGY
jgi:hypothetical protein